MDGALRSGALRSATAGRDASHVWAAVKVSALTAGTLGAARLTGLAGKTEPEAELPASKSK